VPDPERAKELFTAAHAITPELAPAPEAMSRAAFWLEELAARVAGNYRS
jgi:hypothetical protein